MDVKETLPQDSDHHQTLTGRKKLIAHIVWWVMNLLNLAAVWGLASVLIDRYNSIFNLFVMQRLDIGDIEIVKQMNTNLYVGLFETSVWLPVVIVFILGGYLYFRRSDSLISLVTSTFLISWGTFFVVFGVLGRYSRDHEWLDHTSYYLFFISVVLFAFLFPNGLWVPKRSWLAFVGFGLAIVPQQLLFNNYIDRFTTPGFINASSFLGVPIKNSFLRALATNADQVGFFLIIFVATVIQIHRYRKFSTSLERQQTKWLSMALIIFGATLVIIDIVWFPQFYAQYYFTDILPEGRVLQAFIGVQFIRGALILLIIASILIAIVRHQWLNIDLVINRSLVYGGMTAIVLLLFGGSLYLVSNIFANISNGPVIAVAVAATIFGISFQSIRRSLQHFVDRRFYGIQIKYDKTPITPPNFSTYRTIEQFGEYSNLELIGRGGMSEVYQAKKMPENSLVALKLLPPDLVDHPVYRKRFDREAAMVETLDHKNIIRVLSYGDHESIPFIAMELIEGKDLSEHLQRVGKMPIDQILKVIKDVTEALDYAHEKGLVHRDIKPSNVMLDWGGDNHRAVLMDFGVAKILEGVSLMTKSGFLGTLDYIAPEQIQASADVDHRADVYALGVMVYQMLAGELPFDNRNPGALLLSHLSQPPPDIRDRLPEMPRGIAVAIKKAMAKTIEERFESAGQLYQELVH